MDPVHRIVRSLTLASLALPFFAAPSASASHAIEDMNDWAGWVDELVRGPLDIRQPGLGNASFGIEANAIGPASDDTFTVVSLGDGGAITLGFVDPVVDGPGDDFAVFENGFFDLVSGFLFGELAFVQVSSNGIDFAEFSTDTWNTSKVPGGATIDPADYAGFAGVDPSGLGTGFDLAELVGHPLAQQGLLDLQDVAFVRLVDVIGDGSTFDDAQNPVYDPYATIFPSGGFDVDGVGAINVPEPTHALLMLTGLPGLALLARRRRRGPRYARSRAHSVLLATALALSVAGSADATYVVDFEDLGIAPESFWNGSDLSGGYQSGPVTFQNVYTDFGSFDYWYGFAASTTIDSTTPGFGNQYSAVPGAGVGGSATYSVFFDDAFDDPRLVLPQAEIVDGFHATNTTYAFLSMRDGDAFAKQFGGPTGDDPDWLTLTISGYDALGALTGTVDFDLADFRFTDNSLDYILDAWTWVDLTSLGTVKELGFELASSDTSGGFLNTPGYFAMDGFQVVPEPGSALLLGLGLAGLALGRQR